MTMSHKTVQARVNNSLTHPFETNIVLKQDWLALLLSNLALEQVIRNLPVDTKGTLLYKSHQIVVYADDLNIIERFFTPTKDIFINQ